MPSRPASPAYRKPTSSLWPLIFLLVLVHLSAVLYTLPLNRVVELRLCEEYYKRQQHGSLSFLQLDGSIPEKMCKVTEVQRKLAWIQGSMETIMVVCDFIVTIPFGFVAQKWGIRVVLWCNLVPRIFMSAWAIVVGHYHHLLPTKAIIAGPFLNVLGGECVFQSTIFTLTSSLTSNYVQRASHFSYISSTSYAVSFTGPSLAAFAMSKNLWLPFYTSILLLTCAVPTIRMLPDIQATTLPKPTSPSTTSAEPNEEDDERGAEYARLLRGESTVDPEHPYGRFYTNSYGKGPNPSFRQSVSLALRKTVNLAAGRRNFQILLVSFFLTALASSDTKLLVQYISKRYEWTFAEAGYLLSAKALVNFTLLAIIVPRIIRHASTTLSSPLAATVHRAPSPPSPEKEIRINIIGAEISILISVVGVLCIALAFKFWMLLAALIIYALGSALPVFTMSLVKSPLIALTTHQNHNPHHNSPSTESHANAGIHDFSLVMLTKTLGSLVGAPLMTVLWVHAIKLGDGVGLGLPYFVSACVYLVAVFVVRRLGR